jgi:cell wall-associated NlpC family hydrolase
MKVMKSMIYAILLFNLTCIGCYQIHNKRHGSKEAGADTTKGDSLFKESTGTFSAKAGADTSIRKDTIPAGIIRTGKVKVDSVLSFAKSLLGTPYRYASTDPKVGFDCSGYITYVFNHFNIKVPRSSIEFANQGAAVPAEQAKKGDLILFTGTDSTERDIGHIGLIISTDTTVQFIHSSSGKAHGVTITPLNNYYKGRYLKTIRIFPENF